MSARNTTPSNAITVDTMPSISDKPVLSLELEQQEQLEQWNQPVSMHSVQSAQSALAQPAASQSAPSQSAPTPVQLDTESTRVTSEASPTDNKAGNTGIEVKREVTDAACIEDHFFFSCWSYVVSALNEKLCLGDLTAILQVPVISREIRRDDCQFTNFTLWRLNQTDILLDVDINIENLTVTGKDGDYTSSFALYASLWFNADSDFQCELEEMGALANKPDRSYWKLDRNLVPILSREGIEAAAEEIWRARLKEALVDHDQRRAFRLVDAYKLKVKRLRLAGYTDLDHVLFFRTGKIMVQGEVEKGSKKLPPPHEEEVAANTIVLNTAMDPHDDYTLALYKACFEYEWLYAYYAFNNCTDTRPDMLGKKVVTAPEGKVIREPMDFIPGISYMGGFALMMPDSIMQDKVWREYQKASVEKSVNGYINHDGMKYHRVIRTIAEEYVLCPFRVKQRIVQMGKLTARGALNYDPDLGAYFLPFCFSVDEMPNRRTKFDDVEWDGTPTYSITRGRLLKLYKSSEQFRALMSTGDFAFIDGLVCLNDTEALKKSGSGFMMMPTANANVHRYCLRFFTNYVHGNSVYRFNMDDFKKKCAPLLSHHSAATLREQKVYKQNLIDNCPATFPEALKYLMLNRQWGRMDAATLSKRSGLSESTIAAYLSDEKICYELDKVVAICVALNLPPWQSSLLMDRAGLIVPHTGSRAHYGMIIDCLYMDPVKTVQAFLKRNKIATLELDVIFTTTR